MSRFHRAGQPAAPRRREATRSHRESKSATVRSAALFHATGIFPADVPDSRRPLPPRPLRIAGTSFNPHDGAKRFTSDRYSGLTRDTYLR
jgi:hypothetical protein